MAHTCCASKNRSPPRPASTPETKSVAIPGRTMPRWSVWCCAIRSSGTGCIGDGNALVGARAALLQHATKEPNGEARHRHGVRACHIRSACDPRPLLTFSGDPFRQSLIESLRYESDAIVAIEDGRIARVGPASAIRAGRRSRGARELRRGQEGVRSRRAGAAQRTGEPWQACEKRHAVPALGVRACGAIYLTRSAFGSAGFALSVAGTPRPDSAAAWNTGPPS